MGETCSRCSTQSRLRRRARPGTPRTNRERFRQAAAVATRRRGAGRIPRGPVNAFALPGGIIVVFDELVELAGDDERVLGVLGHELGHVVHRHSMRQLFQALGVGALAGLVWATSRRLRQRPARARCDALWTRVRARSRRLRVAFLRANNLSPRPLYEFFVRVQGLDGKTAADQIPDFLSTHPGSGRVWIACSGKSRRTKRSQAKGDEAALDSAKRCHEDRRTDGTSRRRNASFKRIAPWIGAWAMGA